jgi:hypothetical protein
MTAILAGRTSRWHYQPRGTLIAQQLGAPVAQQPSEPDPRLTPGDTLAVYPAQLCVTGYSRSVRNVSPELKRAVYAEYGIAYR